MRLPSALIEPLEQRIAPAALSIGDVSVNEGNSGIATAIFTVTLGAAPAAGQTVTVNYTTQDITATVAGDDYEATNGTLTFAAGETTKTIAVAVNGDTTLEVDETFRVTLSTPSSGTTIADGEGIGTIVDNELPPKISVADVTVAEGDNGTKTAIFTLTLSEASPRLVSVQATTANGTATAGVDYVAFDQTISFVPGQLSRTVSVTVNSDFEDEADETFSLNLSAPVNVNTIDGDPVGQATITNDDLRVLIGDAILVEGNTGTGTMTFTVTLSAPATHPVSVQVATAQATGDTAVPGPSSDYVAAPLQTLTFELGDRTKTFTVTINGDNTPEETEFFTVALTNPVGAAIATPTARGTISNDETLMRISDARVIEGGAGATAQMVFTVTLENGPTGENVTVKYGTGGGSATAGEDYTAVADGTLTFTPGQTTQTISIPVLGDATAEVDEDFVVTLTDLTGTGLGSANLIDATGTGTILNDEGALVMISDATIVEGDSGSASMVFVVSLVGTNFGQATVNFATVDGTAVNAADGSGTGDYVTTNGQLQFSSGATQRTISVPIIGDRIREGTQTFRVLLTDSSGASLVDTEAVGTITDNDAQPTVSISGGNVLEGASGTRNAVFIVTLDGGSETPVTVNFATQPGTAESGADFTATTATLTFAPGQAVQSVNVPVVGDATVEPDETFTGVLSVPPGGATLGTSSAVMTIRNDDILATIGNGTGPEGSPTPGKLTVTLSAEPQAGAPVTVNFVVTPGTATLGSDFSQVGTATSLVFGPGETTKEIDFNLLNDSAVETSETFSVTLTGATNAALGTTTTGTFTITDDETGPIISIANATATETDGSSTMNFTVTLSAPSQQAITVKASTTGGTATPGSDYTEQTGVLISFAPGEATKNFSVPIIGNDTGEATETFTVTLSEPTGDAGIGTSSATGTINDDDLPSLSVSDVSIAEGNSGTKEMTFTVNLTGTVTQAVTVKFATANSSATANSDYVEATGTLTFAPANGGTPAETSKTVTIVINGDTTPELDEFFFLRLTNPSGATITDGEAQGRIQNDETQFRLVPVGTPSVEESNGTLTFKIQRIGTQAGSVTYTTVDGTAVGTGSARDYVAVSKTVNFAANEMEKTITVQLVNDLAFENDEQFFVRLTNSTGGVLVDSSGAVHPTVQETVTITADNDTQPKLALVDVSVSEGNPDDTAGNDPDTTDLIFTVTLTAPNQKETVTVDFMTVADEARDTADDTFAADFIAASGTLTFQPGVTSQTVTVKVLRDAKDEANEKLKLQLSNPEADGVAMGDPYADDEEAIGTINDDDATPTISFEGGASGDITVTEGDSGESTATLKIKLSAASERPVTVTLNTVASTATLNEDFKLPEGFPATVTFAPGETTKEVSYTIIGDGRNEANETFTLSLSNAVNATLFDNAGKVTITNDDATPALAINSVSQVEGDGAGQQIVFTVTLVGSSDQVITVDFASADVTARSSGPGADFTAVTGTLTWAAGDTAAKTIVVPISGDTFKEVSETFTVGLSGAENASIVQTTGTGTILPDNDTAISLSIRDAVVVEGNSGTKQLNFTVELSAATNAPVTFSALTRNGTAVRNGDYGALVEDGNTTDGGNDNDFTIEANQSSMTIAINVVGDGVFESTESLFMTLGSVSEGVALIDAEARGTIYNDDIQIVNAQTLRYIDEDGDLATVQITKGALRLTGSQPVLRFRDAGSVGGKILEAVDFTSNPLLFNGTDLFITADPQPGFRASGGTSNGQVDVGIIQAAIAQPDLLTFTNGIDFNNVTVEGDVAKIVVGDIQTTPAIVGTLSVQSLGARGTATLPSGVSDNLSAFLSTVNSLVVSGDVHGIIQVVGGDLGDINSLRIGGALRGGTQASSGQVFFTGTLVNAVIGEIVGGSGENSGLISGSFNRGSAVAPANIGTLRVLHGITGGSGQNSGKVLAPNVSNLVIGTPNAPADLTGGSGSESGTIVVGTRLEKFVVHGDIVGGTATSAGEIFAGGSIGSGIVGGDVVGGSAVDSGSIVSRGGMTSLVIKGNVEGGGGQRSGTVQVSRVLGAVTIGVDETLTGGPASADDGNIIGGRGELSGTVSALGPVNAGVIHGSILGGAGNSSGGFQSGGVVTSLDVRGDIEGGSSASPSAEGGATTVARTGFVSAKRIAQMVLGGDLKTGQNNGNGLADSGVIRVTDEIQSLVILGDVIGNASARAVISAGGSAAAGDLTVTRLIVRGNTEFLDVLGGYSSSGSASSPRGTAFNPDAQMGIVTFVGSVLATNIANGVAAGSDGLFGTADDDSIGGGAGDDLTKFATIAKVILRGTIQPNDPHFGIAAEQVVAVTVGPAGTTGMQLNAGAGNDFRKGIAPAGSNFFVNEVAV